MATSTFKNSDFFLLSNTYTVSGGNIRILDNRIFKNKTKVIVQMHRDQNDESGYLWNQVNAYPRIASNGELYVYFRDTSGNNVNGKVVLDIFASNMGGGNRKVTPCNVAQVAA